MFRSLIDGVGILVFEKLKIELRQEMGLMSSYLSHFGVRKYEFKSSWRTESNATVGQLGGWEAGN